MENTSLETVESCLNTINSDAKNVTTFQLAQLVEDKIIEKYDEFLPNELLTKGFGRRCYDIHGMRCCIASINL